MGMGTLLSTYPQGLQVAGADLGVVSQPLVAPMQAWASQPRASDALPWSLDKDSSDFYPWPPGKKTPVVKVRKILISESQAILILISEDLDSETEPSWSWFWKSTHLDHYCLLILSFVLLHGMSIQNNSLFYHNAHFRVRYNALDFIRACLLRLLVYRIVNCCELCRLLYRRM